ncbi:MAG: hypothetical protein ACYC2T_04315 [Bacillota bacterium]
MATWVIVSFMLALALGLGSGKLFLSRRIKGADRLVRYILVTLWGVVVATLTVVLEVIAVWPPFDPVSLMLPFVFLFLVLGGLYFIWATRPKGTEASKPYALGKQQGSFYLE